MRVSAPLDAHVYQCCGKLETGLHRRAAHNCGAFPLFRPVGGHLKGDGVRLFLRPTFGPRPPCADRSARRRGQGRRRRSNQLQSKPRPCRWPQRRSTHGGRLTSRDASPSPFASAARHDAVSGDTPAARHVRTRGSADAMAIALSSPHGRATRTLCWRPVTETCCRQRRGGRSFGKVPSAGRRLRPCRGGRATRTLC